MDMTRPASAQRLRDVAAETIPLRSLLLAVQLVLGILGGYLLSGRCAQEMGNELGRYLESYLAAASGGALSWETVAQTLICFYRAPIAVFLLGFASIGVIGIPLLCAVQGFVFSFSLFSFAAAVGRQRFLLLLSLFALRMVFVLPATFLLAGAALDKARDLAVLSLGGGKRVRPVVYGSLYWYRFAMCCVCLLIGCALELWLLPLFLSAV